ncbi:MAG: PDZ domain-containing protein [Phycisphaerales bacterium JB043]
MKTQVVGLVCSGMLVGCAVPHGSGAPVSAPDASRDIESLREDVRAMITESRDRVYPALVNISVVTVQYWDGRAVKGRSTGSGTIISPDGYVVTNQHVTDGGEEFICTLADKQELPARLVGEDPLTDLAVLRLDLSEYDDSDGPLYVATFGDSSELTVGDYVMAMGSPFSLSRSVTLGIVSNTERIFAGGVGSADIPSMELESGQRTGLFTNWIQHDALIQPGNSGGPLVNLDGQIVGVNELGGSAMGFAIPSNLARQVTDLLIEHGEVPRSWIGVSVRTLENTGLDRGVLIGSVVEDSPADEAGLEPGDVITRIRGEDVTVRFLEQIPVFMKRIADLEIGSSLDLLVERDGRQRTLTLTTDRMLQDLGSQRAMRAWGITVRDITPRMARERRLENDRGVLVTSVRSGSPSEQAQPALSWGDVVLAIDGTPVETLDDALEIYTRIGEMEEKPERVMIQFDRGGKNNVTLIKPQPDKPNDPARELPKAWVGISTQPITKRLASALTSDSTEGYRITRVYPGTLAHESELRVGDIVLAVDGRAVTPRSQEDGGQLARALRRMRIGSTTTLTVLRDGRQMGVEVELEESPLPQSEARRERTDSFGLVVRELTFYDRDDNRWDQSLEGVLVEGTETGGVAESGGLRGGEVIRRIGETAIDSIDTYRTTMETIEREKPARLPMIVLHGSQTRYLVIETEWASDARGDE